MTKTPSILTTNIVINSDKIDYDILTSNFTLVKYTLNRYTFIQGGSKYAKLHNEYKQKVNLPYYFNTPTQTLYVLFPKNRQPFSFEFEFLNEQVTPESLQFVDIELHVLIKILQSNYFYYEVDSDKEVCQPHFFMQSKQVGKDHLVVGLTIVSPPRINKEEGVIRELQIVPAGKWLVSQNRDNVRNFIDNNYYCLEYSSQIGGYYFRQVKKQFVTEWADDKHGDIILYQEKPLSFNRKNANIDWYSDTDNRQQTRSYITYHFQDKFTKYLNTWLGNGVVENKKYKNTIQIAKASSKKTSEISGVSDTCLPIKALGKIYLYDNRIKENGQTLSQIPFSEIVATVSKKYAQQLQVKFEEITNKDLDDNKEFNDPVLVIQDVTIVCFKDSGFLFNHFDDPKGVFYNKYPNIPKQSLSINLTEIKEYSAENYLPYFEYEIFKIGKDESIDRDNLTPENLKEQKKEDKRNDEMEYKIEVCITELFLKTYILKKWNIFENINRYLPLGEKPFMQQYAYLHNKTFLYICPTHRNLQFIELETPQGKKQMDKILNEQFNVDWFGEIQDLYEQKYWLKKKNEQEKQTKLEKLFFIFSKNTCVELEEPNERVLFDYSKGSKRVADEKKDTMNTKGMTGIHYCKITNAYSVGAAESLNMNVPRANLMRRFDIYTKDNNFNAEEILTTCKVQFVRNKQYTVYPYFFDLINLYLETQGKKTLSFEN